MKSSLANKRQGGFSLIEVLVAVLVLSVGLLGIAALQTFSLKAGQAAYERSQATNLAYEISDQLRVHRREIVRDRALPGLERWREMAGEMLPGGDIAVEILNASDGQVRITVTWKDERAEDSPEEGESVVIVTRV